MIGKDGEGFLQPCGAALRPGIVERHDKVAGTDGLQPAVDHLPGGQQIRQRHGCVIMAERCPEDRRSRQGGGNPGHHRHGWVARLRAQLACQRREGVHARVTRAHQRHPLTPGGPPQGFAGPSGLVAVLPAGHCPLEEVSRVLRWFAASSAGQCGACVNGLPALAGAFDQLTGGDPGGRADGWLDRWSPMVMGRGACKLPDGAVRFLDSARTAFADHIADHRRRGPCQPNPTRILPTPTPDALR